MKEEIKIFFTALMFYTRIPCPSWIDHSEEYINKATRYFPLIGWIVGLACALVVYFSAMLFPASVCIILSMIVNGELFIVILFYSKFTVILYIKTDR